MFSMNHLRNVIQNHNEIPLHQHWGGYNLKITREKGDLDTVGGNVTGVSTMKSRMEVL